MCWSAPSCYPHHRGHDGGVLALRAVGWLFLVLQGRTDELAEAGRSYPSFSHACCALGARCYQKACEVSFPPCSSSLVAGAFEAFYDTTIRVVSGFLYLISGSVALTF